MGDAGGGRQVPHRLILILGSARSGTTWLAHILNSSSGVAYCHEPFSRLHEPRLRAILEAIKAGGAVGEADRAELVREWSRAYHDVRRPPFFRKRFRSLPSSLMLLAWLAARGSRRRQDWFCRVFSPREGADYDVLLKEVEWGIHARALVCALRPWLILIYRHPCAVVASQLRGRQLGLLHAAGRSEWLQEHAAACAHLGFSRPEVLALPPVDFVALQWLVTNRLYKDTLSAYADRREVVYERLCADPVGESRALFEFLGWEMEPQTLRFIRQSTHGGETSLAARLQFHHPYFRIYRDSTAAAEAWKTELTPQEQDRILAIVRPSFPFDEMWDDATRPRQGEPARGTPTGSLP